MLTQTPRKAIIVNVVETGNGKCDRFAHRIYSLLRGHPQHAYSIRDYRLDGDIDSNDLKVFIETYTCIRCGRSYKATVPT